MAVTPTAVRGGRSGETIPPIAHRIEAQHLMVQHRHHIGTTPKTPTPPKKPMLRWLIKWGLRATKTMCAVRRVKPPLIPQSFQPALVSTILTTLIAIFYSLTCVFRFFC
ncbi:hypothetical protein AEM42_08430 [Betaproteobacteria bacterium UKL13-2]|nr:hypothetical protein AEM42_08430 [Betaproteobacteria bacterium UKL13-2]